MKRISCWAKTHKWAARIIIVTGFTLLTLLGIFTGEQFRDLGIILPQVALLLFTGIYLAGVLLYPAKKSGASATEKQGRYWRQKTCDLLLAGSTYLMILFLGNTQQVVFNNSSFAVPLTSSSSLPVDSSVKTYKSIKDFSASMKDSDGKLLKWKERKKLLKEQIKAIKHSKEPSPGGKAALIALSVLIALGLLALLGALACNISCNGSEGLAILVMILGTGLIIFLLIRVIRRITGKKKKEIKNPKTGEPAG